MGEDKDLSVFIKSGHVLYCFFSCVVYSRLKANGKIKLTDKLAILQYLAHHVLKTVAMEA